MHAVQYRVYLALRVIAAIVFIAGLVVLAVGVDTDSVKIDRSALGFLVWLVFVGPLISGVVIFLTGALGRVLPSARPQTS